MLLDPVREGPIAHSRIADEGTAGDVAVALDVVTGADSERLLAGVSPSLQRGGDQAEHGAGRVGGLNLGDDLGVARVELAGDPVNVVSALGDGEGDDFGSRVGDLGDDGLGVIGGVEKVDDGTDHAGLLGAVGMTLQQRVEAILGPQHIAHPLVGRHHPDAADAPFVGLTRSHQPVDVHRLVSAVKASDAKVHDPGGDGRAVVGTEVGQASGRCACWTVGWRLGHGASSVSSSGYDSS